MEVLVLMDNRQRTTGAKMNALIDTAQGRYVSFVDDDDWVATTYVSEILQALAQSPGVDCVLFDVAFYLFGTFQKTFRYGQEYGWDETPEFIYREPAPFMCWSREIMLRYPLPDQTINEDSVWIQNGPWKHEPIAEARIPHSLYLYRAEPGHA